MSGRIWFGLATALLVAGAVVLLMYRDMATVGFWYMVLLVGGTAFMAFTVGYVAGFLTEGGFGPPPGDGN